MLERQGRRWGEKSRSLISPALSITAIVIALGGVAYAADLLPVNSVGQAQLKNKAVGSAEIRVRAVGTRHLKASSVGSRQIRANSIGDGKLATGSVDYGAIGFPIGGSGVQTDARQPVVTTGHCAPWEGPGDPPPCPPFKPGPTLTDRITTDQAGFLRLSGTVRLESVGIYGHTDGTASTTLDVKLDDKPLPPQLESEFTFGESKVIPFEAFAEVSAGTHKVELMLDGFGFDYLDVDTTSAVMTTTVMPTLP